MVLTLPLFFFWEKFSSLGFFSKIRENLLEGAIQTFAEFSMQALCNLFKI